MVLRPHGLKGEIRVSPFSESGLNLQAGRTVYFREQPYRVLRARPDRGAWILQLAGVTERTVVEEWHDGLVEAADATVLRDDDQSYFVYELVGLRVVTDEGVELGGLTEVLTTGANDVYVVDGPFGEILVPAIGDVVRSIDLKRLEMVITPLPGMVDVSQ